MDLKPVLALADRIRSGESTYENLARDLVHRFGWDGATQVVTALRGYVYGAPGQTASHEDAGPLYDRLGWEQSALVAAWFRDARNRPGLPKRRRGGWPGPTSKESA